MRATKVNTAAGIRYIRYRQPAKYHYSSSFNVVSRSLLKPVMMGMIGLVLVTLNASALLNTLSAATVQAQATDVEVREVETHSQPTHIDIPTINVSLPLQPSVISNGQWQVSDHTANYLLNSTKPGENGNIVIYGHNKKDVFSNLHELSEGDEVILHTESGSQHRYQVTEQQIVAPSEVSILNPTPTETLTIYTCYGLFDSQRLVIRAQPIAT